VGDFVTHAGVGGITERWDGTSWTIVASPDPGGIFANRKVTNAISSFDTWPGLNSVSCSTATSCFAVGVGGMTGGVVEQWDGTSWTILTSQKPHGQEVEFDGVSCSSSTDCFLTGDSVPEISTGGQPNFQPLIEHWDGTAWTVVTLAGASGYSGLVAVSCPSATSCAAIGDSARIEHWDGSTWSIAPLVTVTSQSRLNSVSCATATSCFAVGSYQASLGAYTLIEHWNGRKWSVTHSPNPTGTFISSLDSVSCTSASRCTAVGTYEAAQSQKTLVERWNGTTWAIVRSPNPSGALLAELNGVSCLNGTNCTAVGLAFTRSGSEPLIEHWNGTTWSVVPAPSPKRAAIADLIGVSCPAATSCTAVGIAESISAGFKLVLTTLIEHWDGHLWTTVDPGNVAGAELIGVSCYSVKHCLAVGIKPTGFGFGGGPVVARLNGGRWSTVSTPSPKGAIQTGLSSVSCRSAASCYAVGSSATASATTTLVEHWNGDAWSIVASANPGGTTGSNLNAVSCPSNSSCTAVGDYSANDGFFTLAERGK
jgi:hypothetical protein